MAEEKPARDWFVEGCQLDQIEGLPERAMEAYKECLRLDDEYVDAYANLGFIYLEREEYEQALKCFTRVTELEPGSPEAFNDLGYVYEKMERLGSAKQMYERAREADPNDVEAYINIGHIADLHGDYEGAM